MCSEIFGALSFEQKLAPKTATGDEEDPECPICFLNFESLNEMTCCKATLCTNCYWEIRAKNATLARAQSNSYHHSHSGAPPCCPFCSQTSFSVVYRTNSNSPTHNSHDTNNFARNRSNSSNSSNDVGSPQSVCSNGTNGGYEVNRNNGSGTASTASSATSTPTMTKQRSGSLGSTPPQVLTSSISDRQDLEKEMRKLRESGRAHAAYGSGVYRSSSYNANRAGSGATAPGARRQTYGGSGVTGTRSTASPSSTASIRTSTPTPNTADNSTGIFNRRADSNSSTASSSDGTAMMDLESQLALLQYFIGTGGSTAAAAASSMGADPEDLEDLLLMEVNCCVDIAAFVVMLMCCVVYLQAIKLSLQDSFTAPESASSSSSSDQNVVENAGTASASSSSSSSSSSALAPAPTAAVIEAAANSDVSWISAAVASRDSEDGASLKSRSDSEVEQLAMAMSLSLGANGEGNDISSSKQSNNKTDSDAEASVLLARINEALSAPAPSSSSSLSPTAASEF
jgi:hypothetical protein